jgi:hypothetical protein
MIERILQAAKGRGIHVSDLPGKGWGQIICDHTI